MRKVFLCASAFFLALAFALPCSAETDLPTQTIGFYQLKDEVPPTYSPIGTKTSTSFQVVPEDYHMGKICYVGTRFYLPNNDIPIDRDWIQFTFHMEFSAANDIATAYREDFFPKLYYIDPNVTSTAGSLPSFPLNSLVELKPLRSSTVVNSHSATLNIMLTKQQYIDISASTSSRYRTIIMPQINSNFMISQLQSTSSIKYVGVNAVQWTDSSDLVPVDEQTLQALAKLEGTIQNGFNTVVLEQGKTNEKLDGIQSSLDNQNQSEWDFGSEKADGMFGDVNIGVDASDLDSNPVNSFGDTVNALFSGNATQSYIDFPSITVLGHKLNDSHRLDFAQLEQDSEIGQYVQIAHNLCKLVAWVALGVTAFSKLNDVIGVISGELSWSSLWSKASSDQTSLFHLDDDPDPTLANMDSGGSYSTRLQQSEHYHGGWD